MKVQIACVTVLAAVAVGSQAASAADFGKVMPGGVVNGGIKDYGGVGGVPVPAPVPVQDYDVYSDWYVGVSGGSDLYQTGSVTEVGPDVGIHQPEDFAKDITAGLSFGRYVTPSLRGEVSFEYHKDKPIAGPKTNSYQTSITGPGPSITVTNPAGGGSTTFNTFDTQHYDVERTDQANLSHLTTMFNVLYDIKTGSRFTPYVGAGLGFTWRRLSRDYNEVATCEYTTNTQPTLTNYPGSSPTGSTCVHTNTTDMPKSFTAKGSTSASRLDLAASLIAGASVDITDTIAWDNQYQLIWENGSIAKSTPTLHGTSTIEYSDALMHEFRTGLRFKFD
jgi:opacity protein-like surface antigen